MSILQIKMKNCIANYLLIVIFSYSPLIWGVELDDLDEVTMQVIEFDEINELGLQEIVRIPLPQRVSTHDSVTKLQNNNPTVSNNPALGTLPSAVKKQNIQPK